MEEALNPLKEEIVDGKLGSFKVDPRSLKFEIAEKGMIF